MKISEKKDWAKLLFTREGMTQKEIAEKVGTSTVTVCRWVEAGGWKQLKQSMLITREEQLRHLYMQLEELNTAISERGKGERYADNKDADIISKLTKSIKTMETEASLTDIVEVCKRLLNWLRPISPDKAKDVSAIFDEFIRDVLKR
jgi:uncharacterized protein YjcR